MTPGTATASVYELRVLGSPELRRGDGTDVQSILAQPKRLAVLIYLATAPPGEFHQRDKLLAMFWPDLDQERARAALSQAIYTLRRSLGAGILITRGATDVALAAGTVAVDAATFETAIACGQWKRAFDLYRGEFLEGFHVSGASGFEEWLDQERSRLRDAARDSAWKLSRAAEEAGSAADAAVWARRVFSLAPYDESELRRLITLLGAAGDTAGAAQAYQQFARWLRVEMEREPAEGTRALIARLTRPTENATLYAASTGDSERLVHERPELGVRDRPARASRQRLAAIAVAAVVTAAGAALFLMTREHTPPSDPNHIAVLPFTVRGSEEIAYLSQGMVSLLSAGLHGAGATTIVDPQAVLSHFDRRGGNRVDVHDGQAIAARFGAGAFVLGDVVAVGGALQITARLYNEDGSGPAVATAVAAQEKDILATVDTLARKLLSDRLRTPAQRLEKVGLLATPSFAAAKAYLEGENHYRAARYEEAFESYRRAVTLDTAFAIAHYRLATVADWVNATDMILSSLDRAVRFSSRADKHERQLIQALSLFWNASTPEADAAYAWLLRTYPDDIDAWYQYGELLFHQGMYIGRPLRAAEDPFRHVIALQPDHQAALAHLMRIAAFTGRAALVDSLGKRIDAITPNMQRTPDVPLLRAFASHDTAAISRLLAGINEQPDYPVWVIAWRVAAYTRDMQGALAIIQSHMRNERSDEYRSAAYISAAHFEAARGRFRAADSLLTHAATIEPEGALRTRAFLAALPFAPTTAEDLSRLRAELRAQLRAHHQRQPLGGPLQAHLGDPRLPLVLDALLAVRMNDTVNARTLFQRIPAQAPEGRSTTDYSNALRAALAARGSNMEAKRAVLASWVAARQSINQTPRSAGYTYAYENYLRAMLLDDVGQPDDALSWFDSFGNDFGYDVVFFAPGALNRARILEGRGMNVDAAREYRRFLELWKDADPALQPQVRLARERLRSLGKAAAP